MYEDLDQLANLKLGKMIERLARENATRMSGIIRDHAQRGLAQSGILQVAKVRSQLQMARELCRVPRLCTATPSNGPLFAQPKRFLCRLAIAL